MIKSPNTREGNCDFYASTYITKRRNNVGTTSMQRNNVASTSIRRCFTFCVYLDLLIYFSALNEKAKEIFTDTSSTIELPGSLEFDALHAQLTCAEELFELYIEIEKPRLINGSYAVEPYVFFVPPKNEIGLSSSGESQFHVFVNRTGTSFSFGMLGAEVSGKKNGRKAAGLFTHSAFSFLPDNPYGIVRLNRIPKTSKENHFDVILRHPALHKYGGILSLLAACPITNSIITRMDMKQTVHIHHQTQPVVPLNFLSFANVNVPTDINVHKNGKALIRCKAIGNPQPSLELSQYDENVGTVRNLSPDQIPTYETSLPFEVTKTFQFINVNASQMGTYACKAQAGKEVIYKKHVLMEI